MRLLLACLIASDLLAGCGCSETGLEGRSDSTADYDSTTDFMDALADTEPDPAWDTSDPGPDGPVDAYPEIPDVSDDAPVAVLVGPPVPLDEDLFIGGPPTVAWNGSGWGVAWSGGETPLVFCSLDADARPTGPIVTVAPGLSGWHTSLAWKEDHYGISVATVEYRSDFNVYFGTIDPTGRLVSGMTWIDYASDDPDIAWSEDAHGWVVGFTKTDPSTDEQTIQAALLDDASVVVEGPIEIWTGDRGSNWSGPRVVELKGKVAMAWPERSGAWFRCFEWPDVGSATPAVEVLPAILTEDSYIEAEAFFDYTLVLAMDGADALVSVVSLDGATVVSGPTAVGHSGIMDRRPGIVAANGRGYLGVCYETGPGPAGGSGAGEGVTFRIIAPSGPPVGAELTVVSDLGNIGGCAIGWSGSEFNVIYWSTMLDDTAAPVTMYAQRVRPLI